MASRDCSTKETHPRERRQDETTCVSRSYKYVNEMYLLSSNRAHLHLSRLNTDEIGNVAFVDDTSGEFREAQTTIPN